MQGVSIAPAASAMRGRRAAAAALLCFALGPLRLAAEEEEEDQITTCSADDAGCAAQEGGGGAASLVAEGERLLKEARVATDHMDASRLIQEATAAYKKAADADDSLASRLWSEIGFVNRDYYLALMDEAKAARRQAAAENIDLLQGKEEDRIKFHIVQAYDAYVELTDGLNTTDTAEWRRLASMREEMGRACGWQPCGWFGQEEPEEQVLATYERALERDPHWTHGWTRVVVVLRKNPELRAAGGEGDLLDALGRAAAALPLSLRHKWQQSERTDVRWLRVLAASMHAERGETAESIRLTDGLGRAQENDSIETGVLDGQGLAELYGSPWEPKQENQPEPEAEDALVRAWRGALPPRLQEALENGFRIESDYWGVGYNGAYQGDYYSHWLDLDAEPTNAIHQAVQHIAERTLSAAERAQISGVEWWAHRRPYLKHSASEAEFNRTRYLAHHLHYDTDDVTVEKEGAWHHPKFSSVLYLSDGGGPSLIINQTLTDPIDPTANGVFMTPLSGVFARFKGDLLHTVLPPKPPAPERVTLTIAFWGHEHRCVERMSLECVDDRVPELPQLSYHWQHEFPLAYTEEDGEMAAVTPRKVARVWTGE